MPIKSNDELVVLGRTIRKCRNNKSLSRDTFAELCSITPRYMCDIELGKANPSFLKLKPIIRELSISANLLFMPQYATADIRFKKLFDKLLTCSNENQIVVINTMECLIEQLNKRTILEEVKT